MPIKIAATARQYLLALLTNKAEPEDLLVKLFVNDITPDEDDISSLYVEAEGAGYAPKRLGAKDWSFSNDRLASKPQTWEFSGPLGPVYGYFVVRERSGQLMWAESFPEPFPVTYEGDEIRLALEVA
jgi:hypothetical protein